MCEDKKSRLVIKQGSGVPTIPASTDHRNGDWLETDIYDGELYLDNATGIIYTSNAGVIQKAGNLSDNFANADLTFTSIRTHDLDGYGVELINGAFGVTSTGAGVNNTVSFIGDQATGYAVVVIENTLSALDQALTVNSGIVRFITTPTYASEATATTAGLLSGTIYKTATGELRIKL